MIDLSNVTILSINTHAPEMSVRALQYSSKEIKFKNKKILSNRIPVNLPDDIEFIQIPEFHRRDQYSDFVINNLGDYVCFNGGKDFHEVKPITNGIRDVLIIWFSKKQSKFSLI